MTARKKIKVDPAALEHEIAALKVEIAAQEVHKAELLQKLECKDYTATTKKHIKLLHEYNEIRDVGHSTTVSRISTKRSHLICVVLIEKIAVEEQVLQREVMERFGVTLAD